MDQPGRALRVAVAASLATVALAACREPVQPRAAAPRPVTVVELVETDPTERTRLAAVVESWAEQDIAFEVFGTVTFVAQENTVLDGRWVENGEVILEGDVLARIDPTLYQAAVASAEAEETEARIQFESALPAQVDVARARSERETLEFDRTERAHERGAATDIELATARASRDAALASLREAEAAVEGGRAALDRAQASLRKARIDLESTTLYAPYTGEVSEIHIRVGGFAQVGGPVARMVMMDPIEVEMTVSAETARLIRIEDPVRVFVSGEAEPVRGKVYQKSTVADAATRTFTITALMRNRRVQHPGLTEATLALPRAERIFPVAREDPDGTGPLFVEEQRGLRRDAEGAFVWEAEDLDFFEALDPADPTIVVRKRRVVPGTKRMNFQGSYLLRELADPGGLDFMDAIVLGVPDGVADGDRVAVIRDRWVLRPGDLVRVSFDREAGVVGLYVPLESIVPDGAGGGSVFAVRDDRAVEIVVTLHEIVGQLQRIESPELVAGDRVISKASAYVQDGEAVSIVEVEPKLP